MLHAVIIGTATEFITRTLHIDIIRHWPLTVTAILVSWEDFFPRTRLSFSV